MVTNNAYRCNIFYDTERLLSTKTFCGFSEKRYNIRINAVQMYVNVRYVKLINTRLKEIYCCAINIKHHVESLRASEQNSLIINYVFLMVIITFN